MKRLILPLLTMVALYVLSGCSEKFDTAAPYKDITIAYGLLDMADTAHYIRIQKAFLDQNKSALTMAKESDSSFYKNINVRIERRTFRGVLYDTIHLNRVDLNVEGYPKQPGAFFTAPNYAYKFKGTLDPTYLYRLVVINTATGQVDSSVTPIIDDIHPKVFGVYVMDDSGLMRAGLDFSQTGPNKYVKFDGNYYPPSDYDYNGQSSPAYFGQCVIRFNWLDSNMLTGEKTPQYYDYQSTYVQVVAYNYTFKIFNTELYNALATGMGTAPDHIARLIGRCNLSIYLGTYEYYLYLQSSLTQGTGLTGNEIQPVYTNIQGVDALGLYTARGKRTTEMTIVPYNVDSLIQSPLLTHANIRGTSYH